MSNKVGANEECGLRAESCNVLGIKDLATLYGLLPEGFCYVAALFFII